MKKTKLCLARPFPFLCLFASIVAFVQTCTQILGTPSYLTTCLFASTANSSSSRLSFPCYAETQGMYTLSPNLRNRFTTLEVATATGQRKAGNLQHQAQRNAKRHFAVYHPTTPYYRRQCVIIEVDFFVPAAVSIKDPA